MSTYYGVHRSNDYLVHYGIKGMKWGVRKAIERGDKKALKKHWDKANKKLSKLRSNTDVLKAIDNREEGLGLMGAGIGVGGLVGGLGALSKGFKNFSGEEKFLAGSNAVIAASLLGMGAHGAITGSSRSSSKGHAKAVRKVNEWQDGMSEAFKGTKYAKLVPSKLNDKDATPGSPNSDSYTLYEYGALKPAKGDPIEFRTPTVSVRASEITRNKNSLAKEIFKQRSVDSPVTSSFSDVPPQLMWQHNPTGKLYPVNYANRLVKIKKKRS